jgi:tetraacyldisaccharide 4'-kinase
MATLAERLERIWYGHAPVPAWLAFLETVYRMLLVLRRGLFRAGLLRVVRLPVPVVVVGNITVGGTGKTPLTAWLVRELSERGWSPGVVLRGYRSARSAPRLVGHESTAAECGDEAVLLRQATQRPVAVGVDRAAAAALLVGQGCDVIVADDGLQHWRLARDLEIVVIDGERRYGNGRLLPAGPLREPVDRVAAVDHRVCNGGVAAPGEWPMRVDGAHAVSLVNPAVRVELASWRGSRIHAVAGIGNPDRFFNMLAEHGLDVIRHPLPDHHHYDGSEIAFGDDLPVLMTEKDAVKCAAHADARCHVVPVEAQLPAEFPQALHQHLCALRRRSP